MKKWAILGAVSGLIWVAVSAKFGHGVLSGKEIEYFQKAQLYHIVHTIMILWLSVSALKWGQIIASFYLLGILLFSGSLYLMSTVGLALNYIVPIGGICFLLAWLLLIVSTIKQAKS